MTITISTSMNDTELKVEQVKWLDEKDNLRHVRTVVFVGEQQVPEDMEWDEHDESCIHVLASIGNEVVATGRLLETGQIGRMAVLKSYRKLGVGSEILKNLLFIAESISLKEVFLNSQVTAIGFYNRFGFKEEGGVFDDAGIPHKRMTKQLY